MCCTSQAIQRGRLLTLEQKADHMDPDLVPTNAQSPREFANIAAAIFKTVSDHNNNPSTF